jgi:hypothetical protein
MPDLKANFKPNWKALSQNRGQRPEGCGAVTTGAVSTGAERTL